MMRALPISNPFPGAACLLVESAFSTQDEARRLAGPAFPYGSLVAAESQGGGRGRIASRRWESEAGKNLLFTIRLDPAYARAPALPLRVGAALCRAVEALAEGAGGARGPGPAIGPGPTAGPRLKWPNDLLFGDRKAAGMLCEAAADGLYAGIGVNCNQRAFPGGLAAKATSLALELGREVDRWALLELFLGKLKAGLEEAGWRPGVEALLWRRGELVRFVPGLPPEEAAGTRGPAIEGRLEGIDASGSLVLSREGGPPEAFASGELLVGRSAAS